MSLTINEAIECNHKQLMISLMMNTALGVFAAVFLDDDWLDQAGDISVALDGMAVLIRYLAENNRRK